MKLITEEGISSLEKTLQLNCLTDRCHLTLKFLGTSTTDIQTATDTLNSLKIKSVSSDKTLFVKQEDLLAVHPEFFKEERVWLSQSNTIATLTKEMDQQRLSNCVGLLDLFLKTNRIAKDNADDYLKRLEEAIVPELVERFDSEILPYKPHYDWERKLLLEAEKVS